MLVVVHWRGAAREGSLLVVVHWRGAGGWRDSVVWREVARLIAPPSTITNVGWLLDLLFLLVRGPDSGSLRLIRMIILDCVRLRVGTIDLGGGELLAFWRPSTD